jgi:diguanylate cyclase (GGDEF)-like protein
VLTIIGLFGLFFGLIIIVIAVMERSYKIYNLKKILATQSEQLRAYKDNREDFAMQMSQINSNLENNIMDTMTQLLNRQTFDKQFSNLIAQSKRFNKLFAVLLLDLNKFSGIASAELSSENKKKLLIEVAERLKKTIRDADIACHDKGDTFIVLLPNMLKPEIIVHAAERIINDLSLPIQIDEAMLEVNVYVGIAIYPFDGETKGSLIANARTALDRARAGGKNVFHFYQHETQMLGERELTLKSAIKSQDFLSNITLEYKPYYNTSNNEVACIDVIASLKHPDLGKISFDEFVRIAHYSAKMFELYEWMMKSTIEKFDLLDSMDSVSGKPKRFIFNFNLKQFETPNFLEKIVGIIKKLSSNKNQIIMEIRDDGIENAKLESFKEAIIKLNESHIPISIGILVLGHFALNKLHQVTFSYLKIDEKLVKDLGERQESQAILEKIMLLASNLQIGTLTNGVDTEEKKTILENLGCVTMQGKLFNKKTLDESFFIES